MRIAGSRFHNSYHNHNHSNSRREALYLEIMVGCCLVGLIVFLCVSYRVLRDDTSNAAIHLTWEENGKHSKVALYPESFDITSNTSFVYASIGANHYPSSGYPHHQSLLQALLKWNPDQPDPPHYFTETIMHFNYSDPKDRLLAEKYRDAELPFKLYDIPELNEVKGKWTDKYLGHTLEHNREQVEVSKSNHFMYWSHYNKYTNNGNYQPPTDLMSMSFADWLQYAKRADALRIDNASTHYYFMTGTNPSDKGRSFIARDLRLLSTPRKNFFITNVAANKGIQCRFAMRGIVSESHYDAGKNFVFMVKGNKRYILTPPQSCKYLGIIADKNHPSYRHSIIDWSDIEQAKSRGFDRVSAIDTIVRAGEALYIPSYWFHYIVALQYSVQCNSRSGSPLHDEGKADIDECLGTKKKAVRRIPRS